MDKKWIKLYTLKKDFNLFLNSSTGMFIPQYEKEDDYARFTNHNNKLVHSCIIRKWMSILLVEKWILDENDIQELIGISDKLIEKEILIWYDWNCYYNDWPVKKWVKEYVFKIDNFLYKFNHKINMSMYYNYWLIEECEVNVYKTIKDLEEKIKSLKIPNKKEIPKNSLLKSIGFLDKILKNSVDVFIKESDREKYSKKFKNDIDYKFYEISIKNWKKTLYNKWNIIVYPWFFDYTKRLELEYFLKNWDYIDIVKLKKDLDWLTKSYKKVFNNKFYTLK